MRRSSLMPAAYSISVSRSSGHASSTARTPTSITPYLFNSDDSNSRRVPNRAQLRPKAVVTASDQPQEQNRWTSALAEKSQRGPLRIQFQCSSVREHCSELTQRPDHVLKSSGQPFPDWVWFCLRACCYSEEMGSLVLLDLPETVSRSVLVEWLKAKHLLRVGSAFCCRALRSLAFLTTTERTTLDLSSPVFNQMGNL
jgi:hypothetical protein